MILVSRKFWDTRFVSAMIRQHKLNPMPKTGFTRTPAYNVDTECWVRVVEAYEWGCVMFLTYRGKGEYATLVLRGTVDVNDGVVTDGGIELPVADEVPWYADLCRDLGGAPAIVTDDDAPWSQADEGALDLGIEEAESAVELQARPVAQADHRDALMGMSNIGADISAMPEEPQTTAGRPDCVGYYTVSTVCDGGFRAGTALIEPPCTWRDCCLGLYEYCRLHRCAPEDIRKKLNAQDFAHATAQYAKLYGPFPLEILPKMTAAVEAVVVDEKVDVPAPGDEHVDERALGRKKKGGAKLPPIPSTAISQVEMEERAASFWDALLVRMGIDEAADPDHPEMGDVWLHLAKSRSVSWTGYRLMPDGATAFVRLWLKPYKGVFHVHLPLMLDHPVLEEALAAGVPLKPWKHSRFNALIHDVGAEISQADAIELVVRVASDLGIGVELTGAA